MKRFLSLLKQRLISIKNEEFDIRKFVLLFAVGIFFETFSKVLGLIIVLISTLYVVAKGIIPAIIKNTPKIIESIKNSIKNKKEKKKKKKKNKFLKFKKKKTKKLVEEEDTSKKEVELVEEEDTSKKEVEFVEEKKSEQESEVVKEEAKKNTVSNIVKNFKLISLDKFRSKLKVKKDVNGCKIVNGSYRLVSNQIIDSKFNLYDVEPIIETEYSKPKTYTKTK